MNDTFDLSMRTFFLFVAFLIFTSCHNGKTNVSTGNNTIINDFPVTQTVESEKIDLEILGVNTLLICDTFLIGYKASGYNDFFEIYSIGNLQYLGKCLSRGKGPNEFLSIDYDQNFLLENGNIVLWVSDPVLQKRALLNITQSLRTGRTICDTIFRVASDCSYFQVNDSMVLLQKYVPGNICLSVQNQYTGQAIQEYEFLKSYIPKSIPLPLLSMGITKHPAKDLFVGNMLFFNQINVFSSDMKTNFSLSYQPPIDIFETAHLPDSDFILYYLSLRVSSEYIYALYLNKKLGLYPHEEGETEIHVFNWEGAPIARIRIPDNIIYFTVDEKHHYIYGLKGNEELYRYKFEI